MLELIHTNLELCVGCNRCIRECPVEMANITYQDEAGNVKVKTDYTKCINCGWCITACKHGARNYKDNTEQFFEDLAAGAPLSLIVAPSIRTNIPDYKRYLTFFKNRGVKMIYDVSLGADICVWAHIRYLEQNGFAPLITQPCPAIVLYCEKYRQDLLDKLSPIHSPMACTAIYMREYQGITDRIAALSPCIAKSNEFAATQLVQYNVTFARFQRYLEDNKVELPQEETEFDHVGSSLGSLFPMPGGLKENIKFYFGNKINVSRAEGSGVYDKLRIYSETPVEHLPDIFDVLGCEEGCNIGSAVSSKKNRFEVEVRMNQNWNAVADDSQLQTDRRTDKPERQTRRTDLSRSLYQIYDTRLELPRFMREYHRFSSPNPDVTEKDIEKAFALLGKADYEKQHVDCGACGSETCHNMARKIALGVNIPFNCMVKTMEDARREHEENLIVREQVVRMEKMREADERMRSMLDATPYITILFDGSGNVIDCNHAAVEFMGFENKEELSASFMKRMHEEMVPFQPDGSPSILPEDIIAKAAQEGQARYLREFTVNGVVQYWNVELRKIPYGDSFAIVAYIFDITELRERESELARSREQRLAAESANQAKTDFLSTMSHEIRTPMNAILGITEMLLRDEWHRPETKDALDKISNAGALLLGIINDILDMSRIESGKLELSPSEYSIASLINDVTVLNMMLIGSKNINFKLTVDPDTPAVLMGDELRIKQILNNLLSNAVKYTEKGTIQLSVFTHAKNDTSLTLVFKIKDTGMGMTDEQIAVLFDKFTRFHTGANRTIEGVGLGMNITQNLLRIMNGDIRVKSKIGKGSEFTVRIPQEQVGSEVLGKELVKGLQDFRIDSRKKIKMARELCEPMPDASVLVVDDVESNLYVARGLLTPYGLSLTTASSGFEAIDKIKDGNEYDVIFMDHMMPKMDGIETTKIIRGLGYVRPIVALTANVVSGQSDIFLANGFDDIVPKPIDIRHLNAVLKKYARDKISSGVLLDPANQREKSSEPVKEDTPSLSADPQLNEFFFRDIDKVVHILESIHNKRNAYTDQDIREYVIHVHTIKTTLAYIGESELSACAGKLEQAGRKNDTETMAAETQGFLDGLRAVAEKYTAKEKDGRNTVSAEDDGSEDDGYLREQLLSINEACENFDIQVAKDILAELRNRTWSPAIEEQLEAMAEHLLIGDFDEVTCTAEKCSRR